MVYSKLKFWNRKTGLKLLIVETHCLPWCGIKRHFSEQIRLRCNERIRTRYLRLDYFSDFWLRNCLRVKLKNRLPRFPNIISDFAHNHWKNYFCCTVTKTYSDEFRPSSWKTTRRSYCKNNVLWTLIYYYFIYFKRSSILMSTYTSIH